MNNNRYWRIFKRRLTIIMSVIGIIVPILCFAFITKIDLLSEPLSMFGIDENTKYLWCFFIQVVSVLLYLNNRNNIRKILEYTDNCKTELLNYINMLSTASLSITGLVDMNVPYIHIISAIIFFFSYTALIFWWGFLNIKYNLKIALTSIIISLLIILSTITLKMGFGYGVFEVIFIILVIYWNLQIV